MLYLNKLRNSVISQQNEREGFILLDNLWNKNAELVDNYFLFEYLQECPSDEYLEKVYSAADGVLMPSEAESFGLSVTEGAHHGKPLILRDIPIFREIAGEHATYFSGLEPEALANCIEAWLLDFAAGTVIPSSGIRILSWEESVQMLLTKLGLLETPPACKIHGTWYS